jgi:hypothetical protein
MIGPRDPVGVAVEVRTYEITFLGEAGPALCAAFDDFE